MPRKKTIFECKYCGNEYESYEKCTEHEKSHIVDYSCLNTKEIIDTLKEIRQIASGYHIGNMVLGMPVCNFENLIEEVAKRLEKSI